MRTNCVILSVATLFLSCITPFIVFHSATGDGTGDDKTAQETWCSLWEGDGVSPPSSEGWWARTFGSTTLTTGVSDGETVATINDNSVPDGGWMQRFLNFEAPFKIAVRARYDPTTPRNGQIAMAYVFTGNQTFLANFYPTYIEILGYPILTLPAVQGTWYNITFDAKAPLDVDVYRNGVLEGNIEMLPADAIIFDQPLNKPAIATLVSPVGTAIGMVDYIRTTMCPPVEGPVKAPDRIPPQVLFPAIDDGVQPPSGNLEVLKERPTVRLTATIDDSLTGNSSIWSANYTAGPLNWPGTRMSPVDGALDSPTENVSSNLDISALAFGNYTFCFYGRDYQGNKNLTGDCATMHLVPPQPPRIYDVSLDDGMQTPSRFLTIRSNQPGVWLNATADDTTTGNSNIASANYTTGVGNWPGTDLAPLDLWFDSPLERVSGLIDPGAIVLGNHTLCVYATDALGMKNLTGVCAYLNVIAGNPLSQVDTIRPYWRNSQMTVIATASDDVFPVTSVDLYYRHSADNISWSSWRLSGTATSSPWSWSFAFPDGDGAYEFYSTARDSGGYEETAPSGSDASAGFDGTPPITTLTIGEPKYPLGGNFVKSSTPLTLQASDGGVVSVGLDRTEYRVDGGTWDVYSSPVFITVDGVHTLGYRSLDLLTNVEPIHSIQILVDDTPPASTLSIGIPKHLVGGNFVNSSTPLTLHADDGGSPPVGTNDTFYRLWSGTWSSWREYTSSFTLIGRDGTWFVEFLSFDFLGNREGVQNVTLVLDNTPPATTLLPATGPYTTDTLFNLTATDAGSGVNATRYRIDSGNWTNYTTGFTLTEGVHNISYLSIDNLNNTERERWRVVTIEGAPPPPPVEANYKPLVAAVFAIILAVVGLWSSRRRLWKEEKGRMAVAKAFMLTSMPFVVAEAATGILSLLTGQLSIPPPLGIGTAVDLAILLVGFAVALQRTLGKRPKANELTAASRSR